MEVSLNYCSQYEGNLYRTPYYNRNLNIGPRINSNLGQSPHLRRDPSIQIIPTLGPKVLYWAMWIPGVFLLLVYRHDSFGMAPRSP